MTDAALKLVTEDDSKKRKCKNWLVSFSQWTEPRSESPQSVLFWCGLFTLSSILRRKVKIPAKYLQGWECYPFIYVIFVGEQGLIKKSTSIGFTEQLLDELEELNLAKCPEAVTTPELIQRMMDADDSSIYMLLSEFSLLPLKAGFGIYDVLTKLFDGAKKIDEGTIGRGYKFAANPCLNLCAATTPKWIAANINEDVLGGGFGSRVIFIHESAPSKRGLLWGHKVKIEDMDELKQDLIHDLRIIANIEGDFELPGMDDPHNIEKPYGFLEDWYQKNGQAPPGTDPRLKGFFNRKPSYVMKVAMLLHVARSDDLILTVDDLKQAIVIMNQAQEKIASTFANVGRNQYQADMKGMFQFVKDSGGKVTKQNFLAQFSYLAEPRKLMELLQGLLDSGLLIAKYEESIKDWFIMEGE